MGTRVFQILLAEDNPGDVRLFREALRGRQLDHELILAEDGQAALKLIARMASDDQAKLPDIIVLDVNLPKHNGGEVLQQIRTLPRLRAVPIVILTSSESPSDEANAMQLGATVYVRKPSDLEGLMQIGDEIERLLAADRK